MFLANVHWPLIRWKFTRGYVFDGNFSVEQLKMKNPEDDVVISDGNGFLVGGSLYKSHLKVAKELKEVSEQSLWKAWTKAVLQRITCHQYDAINKANLLRQHLIHTGIGAGACSCHGCFVPHCVVNFHKGERWIYVSLSYLCHLHSF